MHAQTTRTGRWRQRRSVKVPAVDPKVGGKIVYTKATHPVSRVIHFGVLAYDGEWRIVCNGEYLTDAWNKKIQPTTRVSCQQCWRTIQWTGTQRKGKKFAY